MRPSSFVPARRVAVVSVVILLFWATVAHALIIVGRGNKPVSDAGWPAGAVDVRESPHAGGVV